MMFENKKVLLGVMTIALILAIIVVSSFYPFILDLTRVGTREFITDQVIIISITISTTISMMFIAQTSNAGNPKSELAKSRVAFNESLKKIVERTAFYQWVKKVLQERDKKDIIRKDLDRLGIDYRVYDLQDSEIRSLTNPQKIDGIFYKSLTKTQIQGIFDLKKRVSKLKFVSPNYYTSHKSFLADKNLSEIASNESKKKVLIVVVQLTLKIFLTFVVSAILASLVRDLAQEGGSTAQAWMRFLSRMFAFITSNFLGYTLGCKVNDLDAFYISKRVEAHTLYLEDKTFVAIDEGEYEYRRNYE